MTSRPPRRRIGVPILSSIALLLGGDALSVSAAVASDAAENCRINSVVSQDITRSFSVENLADTKLEIQEAVQSFVGTPYPVTLSVSSFGRIAPLPSSPPLLGVDVTGQGEADRFKAHVAAYDFDSPMSGYTNWQAGLRDAFEHAKSQRANTVIFVTDGVPNVYTDAGGVTHGVGESGAFDPAAAAAAGDVAAEIRAAGMRLETIFIRTNAPGLHGLDDPKTPTPTALVVQAMNALGEGWSIDQVITIAELSDELRARALATCSPTLSLSKSHQEVEDTNGNGLIDAGDRVVFTFSGRNYGDLPLTGVRVSDPLLRARGVALARAGLVGDLPVGADYLLTSDPYTITDQDMRDCGFLNTATAEGTSLKGAHDAIDTDAISTDTRPGISLALSAHAIDDANGNGMVGDAGDTVVWKATVKNTGNVGIAETPVPETATGTSEFAPEHDGQEGLAPGEEAVFRSAPRPITDDEAQAKRVSEPIRVQAPRICGAPVAAESGTATWELEGSTGQPSPPNPGTTGPTTPTAPAPSPSATGPAHPRSEASASATGDLARTGSHAAGLGAGAGIAAVLILTASGSLFAARRRRALE